MTVSQGITTSSIFLETSFPFSSLNQSNTENLIPTNFPFSTTYSSGEWFNTSSTFSSKAGSNSQSDDFIRSRVPRYITLTLSAPSLKEVLQQSIAVLPPPIMSTFFPIDSMCSKATDSSHEIPI